MFLKSLSKTIPAAATTKLTTRSAEGIAMQRIATSSELLLERSKQRVSQVKLSHLSGVSRFRISMYEGGYIALTPEELEKISNAFKMLDTKGGGRK